MARRSPLQNTAFSLAGQVGARLLSLAYFAVLARHVGPDLYGDIGVGASLGTVFAVVLEPGLIPLFVRDGSRDPAIMPERFAELLGYKVSALLIMWPVMFGLGAALGYRGTSLAAIAFSGGSVLLIAFEDTAAAVLVARERMDLEGTLRVCSKLSTNGMGLAALLLGASFQGIIGAMCAGGMGTAVVGLLLVRRSGLPLSWKIPGAAFARRLREALPLAVSFALWLIVMRLDQLLASLLGISRGDTGDYNSVVKLVESLIVFPTAVALTFQPLLSRAWVAGAEALAAELRVAIEASLALSLPLALGGGALATPLVTLVYGARFSAAGPLLRLQLLVLPFTAIQLCAYHALVATGALRRQALIWGAGLAVNVVANLVLVPRIGISGCSLSALSGGAATVIAATVILRQLGVRLELLRGVWRPGLAAAGMMAVVTWASGRYALVLVLALGAISYAALFFALGGAKVVAELRRSRGMANELRPA